MKKVLIGILILIPVIILGIVTLVSSIASVAAHIGVESVSIVLNEEFEKEDCIKIALSDVANKVISIDNYLEVKVLPLKATNPTVEWSICDIQVLDQEYERAYNYYLEHEDDEDVLVVEPAVMLVDNNGKSIESSTTGNLKVNTYCSFTIKAMAENQQDQTMVKVVGYDVEKLVLTMSKESISVGESVILHTNFTPVDSIVEKIEWSSSDETIAKVDGNGIVTAYKDGQVTIKCKAYKYTDNSQFVENSFALTINKALSVYGNVLYSSSNTLSLSALGISSYDLLDGCSVDGDTLTISSSSAKIYIGGNYVQIYKCLSDDIIIDQAKVLDSSTGYVIAVSQTKIDLSASILSTFNKTKVNAVWTSSNAEIASIDENGKLSTLAPGLVTITSTYGGKTASIELNLQNKVASMQLTTSDSLLSKGLARETVFASFNYLDASVDRSKEFNSVDIIIKGSPKNASEEEVIAFYDAYIFEIVSGNEYAAFDNTNTNKLVFNHDLEGKGKQEIKVKVTAKYPRYETFESYTTSYVTIKAVFGVSISNYTEYVLAYTEQHDYAYTIGNLIATTDNIQVCSNLGETALVSSHKTLAMCFTNNVVFDENVVIDDVDSNIYGDVYGNNYMLSAAKGQAKDTEALLYIRWSNVTVSNLTIRVNELGDETTISAGDAAELHGHAITVGSNENLDKYRLLNISMEYCILENARCSCMADSCDVSFKGCIIRNMSSVGMYFTNRIREVGGIKYILQTNIIMENMIFSNCLGTAFDIDTSLFEIDNTNWKKYNYGSTKKESEAYIKENIVAKGLNGSFTQKGFLDIYNWTSTENISLVEVPGDEKLTDVLKIASSTLIGTNPSLKDYRYRYKSVDYFHLGFLIESMSPEDLGNPLTLNETVWIDISMEDTRYNEFEISSIKDETFGELLSRFGMSIYAYKNNADLKPSSTYIINDKLIDKLHG